MTPDRGAGLTVYERKFSDGASRNKVAAAVEAATWYIVGKPRGSQRDRDSAFWRSPFLRSCPARAWREEPLILALAQYMAQHEVAEPRVLRHAAEVAPDSVRRAVRLSGLVWRPDSPRWLEIVALAKALPDELGDTVRAVSPLHEWHRAMVDEVVRCRERVSAMSLPDLLGLLGLCACRQRGQREGEAQYGTQALWTAIDNVLRWKVRAAGETFVSNGTTDGKSLPIDLSSFLSESTTEPVRIGGLAAVGGLVAAQMELDDWLGPVVDGIVHGEDFDITRTGNDLHAKGGLSDATIAHLDRVEKRTTGRRLYWLWRGLAAFAGSGLANMPSAAPPNNRIAFVMALAAQRRLSEIFGVGETVTGASGPVPVFKALLALELLLTAFQDNLISPYKRWLNDGANWLEALRRVHRQRGPAAWIPRLLPAATLERTDVIARIATWTAERNAPHDLAEAEAILDFWTLDLDELARPAPEPNASVLPSLAERPILRIGDRLVVFPWMADEFDSADAAVNNLRRYMLHRAEVREETARIEGSLADLFRHRDFQVVTNHPLAGMAGEGEVDLICARDGCVLVLEVKSTWARRSLASASLHARSLRRAAVQLERNMARVRAELGTNAHLAHSLGIAPESPPEMRGWILDTLPHHDGRRFADFLVVALEDVTIALRDDSRLLQTVDPDTALEVVRKARHLEDGKTNFGPSLYPTGFSFSSFVDVVESGQVWRSPDE